MFFMGCLERLRPGRAKSLPAPGCYFRAAPSEDVAICRNAGTQFYYGMDNDPLGFPGRVASYPTCSSSSVKTPCSSSANGAWNRWRMEGNSPAGVAPDDRFMNRRALEQLRRSRTNGTSATGVPTLPDSVAGIPIVITD